MMFHMYSTSHDVLYPLSPGIECEYTLLYTDSTALCDSDLFMRNVSHLLPALVALMCALFVASMAAGKSMSMLSV